MTVEGENYADDVNRLRQTVTALEESLPNAPPDEKLAERVAIAEGQV